MDKTSKKGTLTSRTLEKLGFSTFRFRSGSQSDGSEPQKEGAGAPATLSSPTQTNGDQPGVNTIAKGHLDIPERSPKRTLKELFLGTKHGPEASPEIGRKKMGKKKDGPHHHSKKDPVSTSKFYVDFDTEILAPVSVERHEPTTMQDKKKKVCPEGANEYTVQESDTLEKIAARLDTTPSELKKLNRLVTSMIFSGQTIFVPDKDYVPPPRSDTRTNSTSTSSDKNSPPTSAKDNRPQMDVPLVKSGNSSPTKVPGHAERLTPVNSPKDVFDFEVVPPHKLSEDEVQQLDQDCMERFIKLNVKHITDGQGVVRGVLLVTPNAVMFDPDVSDPLVVERGPDKYGMIAPMDLIISAAMYHDIAAMKLKGQKLEDGSSLPKPEVYHDKSCPMFRERLEQTQKQAREQMLDSALPKDIKNKFSKTLTKTDSVCSCGHGAMESDFNITGEESDTSPTDEVKTGGEFTDGRTDETTPEEAPDDDSKENERDDVFQAEAVDTAEIDKVGDLPKSGTNTHKGKKLSVSFSMPESDEPSVSDKTDTSVKVDSVDTSAENVSDCVTDTKAADQGVDETDNKPCDDASLDSGNITTSTVDIADADAAVKTDTLAADDSADKTEQDKEKETRIGNIVYLPVSKGTDGEVNLKALEATQNTLSRMSETEFSALSKSDTNLTVSAENREVEKTRSSSTSSLGPFSPTPHLSAFVNYATGFFQRHSSDTSIKDIKDMDAMDSKPFDLPVISSGPFDLGRRKGKMSRHDNSKQEIAVENAIAMAEKADLLTMDYDRFKPRQSVAYPDPPLYLCLKLGQPQNKNVFHNYSIESYGRRRKKSEYWFSIPREKVDHLYAFFVQWTPEIYGDEDELTAERRGFVVIEDGDEDEDLEMLDEHFGPNSSFQKDWEIISKEEAFKRRSIVFDVPLPLPELIGESAILTDEHISELNQHLPGRTVGYPWTLIYSTDKHGFSLKTLYRDMQGLDSPILLVVKDTSDNVFGALTSCELKTSESFYGTGETFLFTFYPDFRLFPWTGENNFFIKGDQHSLFIGAGQGMNGLWLDEDLYHGRTNRCETFDNDLLTVAEDFVVNGFEAWAFIFD